MTSGAWLMAWKPTIWFVWLKATAACPSESMLVSMVSWSSACRSAGTQAPLSRIACHIANQSVASPTSKPSLPSAS